MWCNVVALPYLDDSLDIPVFKGESVPCLLCHEYAAVYVVCVHACTHDRGAVSGML